MLLHSLATELLTAPIGLTEPMPRLSWKLSPVRPGVRQSAFRVRVASSLEGLAPGATPDLWDSGKVVGDAQFAVRYGGRPLKPFERAHWTVDLWDEQGEEHSGSKSDGWEAAPEAKADDASWIGGYLAGGPRSPCPVPFLRAEFDLPSGAEAARLQITALGVYDCQINGQLAHEDTLSPGWTDYRKRVRVRTYDVTEQVQAGRNAVGVALGDGWYAGHVEWRGRQLYGDRPRLWLRLFAQVGGTWREVLRSSPEWKVAYGPILEADLLEGEAWDARRAFAGWSSPGFDDSAWQPASHFPTPEIRLVAAVEPGIVCGETITPQGDLRWHQGWDATTCVVDFGVNLVGRVRLKTRGGEGKTLRLRYAEALQPDGQVYVANLREARCTDYLTLGHEAETIWEPRFTFHGFRYAEFRGLPEKPQPGDLEALVLHTALERTGWFECSEPLLNQLHKNIDRSLLGNHLDLPTDCPQRNERLGWTGDAQVFVKTACFHRDVQRFYEKWAEDLIDAQAESGAIPSVAPITESVPGDGGPAWADVMTVMPWTIYERYGDPAILEQTYPAIRRFLDFQLREAKDFIRSPEDYAGFRGFGDWLSINAETPQDLIGTAFLAHSLELGSKIADVVGREPEARELAEARAKVCEAFRARFVTADGLVAGGTQTGYVLTLHFGLVEGELRKKVEVELVRAVQRRGNKLSTGFVGTPYLLFALQAAGRLDVAYKVLMNREFPGWLFPVLNGATSIWERWDSWTPEKGFQDPGMNSFNHYAYGAVGQFLYEVVAGIAPIEPGYRRIAFAPQPGGGLTHASAKLETRFGHAETAWRITEGRFEWEVVVPPGAEGLATVPTDDPMGVTVDGEVARPLGGGVFALSSGRYRFTATPR